MLKRYFENLEFTNDNGQKFGCIQRGFAEDDQQYFAQPRPLFALAVAIDKSKGLIPHEIGGPFRTEWEYEFTFATQAEFETAIKDQQHF